MPARRSSTLPAWRDWLSKLHAEVKLHSGAEDRSIRSAETALGVTFPDDLRSLLLASDGVKGRYGIPLVWPVDQIVSTNSEFRTTESFRSLYMPFDHLLFIGADGGGDQFAYPITADGNVSGLDYIFR